MEQRCESRIAVERREPRIALKHEEARTVTGRLEAAVGRDLQYIRINGTVIGGLVGLAIHAVERTV